LPIFGGVEEQSALLNRLRELFVSEWTPDILQRYLAEGDAKAQPRARVNLPWGPMPSILPLNDELRVRWSAARKPVLEQVGDEVHVQARGHNWRFAAAAKPILDRLATGETCSADELVARPLDPSTVKAFLKELVSNGLIVVV
jgi:hypothetical protein